MSYELIISEKPQAAQKIAEALADTKPAKHREHNVNYYQLNHNKKNIVVASAVGHLYGLGEKGGESWKYPVFDTEWKPTYQTNKASAYTKDYIKLLEKLGKEADEVTVASDFDIEGEVIGLNVVRFALKREDANRMKFSTLTKPDLKKAYENKQPHLEWGQAKAGETRHELDWYYGINLSRAFTQSIRKGTNRFQVLSTGRVQAPTLHFLAEREKKIEAFKPEDYSELYLHAIREKVEFKAQYEMPLEIAKEHTLNEEDDDGNEKKVVDKYKIFNKEHTQKVKDETTNKDGTVTSIEAKQFKQNVPTPFDLTSLQMEASNLFGITPKRTLEIAQKLYTDGVTSYPRTSSQKLPAELNLGSILDKLKKQTHYSSFVDKVKAVNPSLKPNEGKKDDPAHPAITPTGEIPKKLEGQDAKIYDLVVKRFFAVFGKPAQRETNTITIDVNSHNFILKGTRTLEKNWHELYDPYVRLEDVELPSMNKGDAITNKEIEQVDKQTQPPRRYTDASIIKELEKRALGTKATRAEILSQLRSRGYIVDKSIKVTELGLKMNDVLKEETPKLVDEELTRQFEEEMEDIRANKSTPQNVLKIAKDELGKILDDIKSKEVDLGKRLAGASDEARQALARLAPCPSCSEGTLVIKTSHKTKKKFAACDKYPDCKTIFNLPQGVVKGLEDDAVDDEGKIWVLAGKTENNMRKICINEESAEEEERELGHKKYEEEGMTCPTCNEGEMKLRKSFYGEFLGCSNYPKCKTMMKIVKGVVDTKNPIVGGGSKDKKTSTKKATKEKE